MKKDRTALFKALLCAFLVMSPNLKGDETKSNDSGDSRIESIQSGFPLAVYRIVDVNNDGAEDLIGVGEQGEVRVWHLAHGSEESSKEGRGSLVLPDPDRTLMAVGDLFGNHSSPQLVLLSPQGLVVHSVGPDGGFSQEGSHLSRQARFKLRVGFPQFTRILPDVNGDGLPDLLVPMAQSCELWVNDGIENGSQKGEEKEGEVQLPRFKRTAVVNTEIQRIQDYEGEQLSDQLECAFWIPYLKLQDVNGDGLPDLVVNDDEYRRFHLQRNDGAIPPEPDNILNLDTFRDTTPEASLRPGKTLAGGDDPTLSMQDLDGDGIPDYVIAHRRKLWIFHGTNEGPQFTKPTTILKVAEDITALLVVPLDKDEYPDLLLLRVQVPAVASLLKGLFTELDVDISASGYASIEGQSFSNTPRWRGQIIVRLPEILGVLKNPEALIRKFEDTASKFRASVRGDFNGDGAEDVAMLSDDETRIEVWKGISSKDAVPDPSGLRSLFFEAEDRVWTIDRVLTWLGGVAERRAARITENRNPDLWLDLRDSQRFRRIAMDAAEIESNSLSVIVVVYRDLEKQGEGYFDIIRVD